MQNYYNCKIKQRIKKNSKKIKKQNLKKLQIISNQKKNIKLYILKINKLLINCKIKLIILNINLMKKIKL